MELIGKGLDEPGAVWVARKVPDGHVTAHANQARIRQFLKDDKETTRWSHDVVDFAVKKGLYDPGSGEEFFFSDVYDPVNFVGARAGTYLLTCY